jgi:hypothetical protein
MATNITTVNDVTDASAATMASNIISSANITTASDADDTNQTTNSLATNTINTQLNPTQTITNKEYKHPYCLAYLQMDPNKYNAKDFDYVAPEPVDGKCKPPFIPPDNKPHRNTNQLQYLLKVVHKAVTKHKHAWPFDLPVDTKQLKLPDYFVVNTRPMDFTTIKKRLENYWYYDAYECVVDFKQVFSNCYRYNRPTEDVVMMARGVEELFLDKLDEMPLEEEVLEIPPKGKGKGKKGGRRITGGSTSSTALRTSQTPNNNALLQNNKLSSLNIDNSSNHSRMDSISPAFSNSTNQSTFQHYNNQDSQATNHATVINNNNSNNNNNSQVANLDKSSLSKTIFDTTSKVASVNLHESNNLHATNQLNNHADISNHSTSSNLHHDRIASPDTASGIGSSMIQQTSQQSSQFDQKALRPSKMSTRRESGRPIKKPQRDLPEPASSVVPSRPKKGRMTERMKYCQTILKELWHKKHYDIAYFFYYPVDADALGLKDYHDVIKQPMDLSTIKKKMENREYRKPDQFANDVRLMLHNSFRYNPPEHDVNKAGRKLQEIFEQRYARLPDGSDDTGSSDASNVPSSESESESGPDSDAESLMKVAKQLQNSLTKISDDVSKFVDQVRNFCSRKRSTKSKRTRSIKYRDVKRSSDQQGASTSGLGNTSSEYGVISSVGAEGFGKGKGRSSSQKRSVSTRPQQPIKKLRTNNSKLNQKQTSIPRPQISDTDDDENEVAMSYDEKRQLSLDINKLPSKYIALALNFFFPFHALFHLHSCILNLLSVFDINNINVVKLQKNRRQTWQSSANHTTKRALTS